MGRVVLEPSGIVVQLDGRTTARDALFAQGVEFPCGGQGRCRGCRVRLLAGEAAVDPADSAVFSAAELTAGWRLGCRLRPQGDVRILVQEWAGPILGDGSRPVGPSRTGVGIAVDIGTTTIVAQLVDLGDGSVRAVRTAWNRQAAHGADLVTRLALEADDAQRPLGRLLRQQVGELVTTLMADVVDDLVEVVLVGNTGMHHLFGLLPVDRLARQPFEPASTAALGWTAAELGWPGLAQVRFLPVAAGFVGSDLLAGILACDLGRDGPALLVDLGTNGEIALAHAGRIHVASTAAGPAFEGARISCGMRATTGAIDRVWLDAGAIRCSVIGGGPARGVCGSGLVAAVACLRRSGRIAESGMVVGDAPLALADGVALQQSDIRELQLAKGAIAAGIALLCQSAGLDPATVPALHVAGAFGNYVDLRAATAIGLLPGDPDRMIPVGNSALAGAKVDLRQPADWQELQARIVHHDLHRDPGFIDAYTEGMIFPDERLGLMEGGGRVGG